MRIVSLLPSATEIVCAIGLGDELVGRHPRVRLPARGARQAGHDPERPRPDRGARRATSTASSRRRSTAARRSTRSTRTRWRRPQPDLILTQELCRVCAVSYREVNEVARAIDADITVVSLEPTSIEGIFNTISTVGAMAEAEDEAVDLVESLRERLGAVEDARPGASRRRAAVAAGRRPRVARPAVRGRPLGSRSRSGAPAAGTCSARTASAPSRRPGTPSREVDPEMLMLMPCGFHLAETVDEWARTPRPAWLRRPRRRSAAARSSRSTARPTSAGPGRGSSTASSCWPRSSIRTASSTSRRSESWTPVES